MEVGSILGVIVCLLRVVDKLDIGVLMFDDTWSSKTQSRSVN